MSKVGESIIQGAIEAIEIARDKDKGSTVQARASTNLSESSESNSKTTEKTEVNNVSLGRV